MKIDLIASKYLIDNYEDKIFNRDIENEISNHIYNENKKIIAIESKSKSNINIEIEQLPESRMINVECTIE